MRTSSTLEMRGVWHSFCASWVWLARDELERKIRRRIGRYCYLPNRYLLSIAKLALSWHRTRWEAVTEHQVTQGGLQGITDRLLGSDHFARFLFGLALFDYRVLWTWELNLGVAEKAWLC